MPHKKDPIEILDDIAQGKKITAFQAGIAIRHMAQDSSNIKLSLIMLKDRLRTLRMVNRHIFRILQSEDMTVHKANTTSQGDCYIELSSRLSGYGKMRLDVVIIGNGGLKVRSVARNIV